MSKPHNPFPSHTAQFEQKSLRTRFARDTGAESVLVAPFLTPGAHEAGQKALEAETQKRHKGLQAEDREKLAAELEGYTQGFREIKSLEELRQRVRVLINTAFLPTPDPRTGFLGNCVKRYYEAACQNLGVEYPLDQGPARQPALR